MDVSKWLFSAALLALSLSLIGCEAEIQIETSASESDQQVEPFAEEQVEETQVDQTEPALDAVQETIDWRNGRIERLTQPYGWLSLVGYYLMEEGSHSIGSASDNDIVVPGGPAVWGQFSRVGETVSFESADIENVLIDDRPQNQVEMLSSAFTDDEPTRIEADGVRVQLSRSGGVPNLRVRSPLAETRTGFAGLDYYEIDPAFRFEAEFIPHEDGNTMRVANVMGQIIDEKNPGIVRFEHKGEVFELETFLYGDELFMVFADRTSGNETYGLGRFLYADLPVDGKTIVDFNQSYNPPCAFTEYTTCSLPPQSNRMDTRIEAGEKAYRGQAGMTQETVLRPAEEI